MRTQKNHALDKLIAKGNLSGFDAARIALAELWEGEHARDAILSPKQQREIQRKLKDGEDISVYNNWVREFGTICEVNHTAHIMSLMAQRTLSTLERILEGRIVSECMRLHRIMMPHIVTEKQFEDLKAKQRISLLGQKYDLGWVLFRRAEASVCPAGSTLENLLEDEPEKAAASFRGACLEIEELVESKMLRIHPRKSVLRLLKKIQNKLSESEVLGIIDSTLSAHPQHSLQNSEPALEKAVVSGEDLYSSGLPEWLEAMDHYHHEGISGVAILKYPRAHEMDGNGHYRERECSVDSFLLGLPDRSLLDEFGSSLESLFKKRLKETSLEISFFLLCRAIMSVLSKMMNINFCEDIDHLNVQVESSLKLYESRLEAALDVCPDEMKAFGDMRCIIDLEKLQPSSQLLDQIARRLQQPLGRGQWFSDCKEYHLKEMLTGLPREEVWEMTLPLGKTARKRIFRMLGQEL